MPYLDQIAGAVVLLAAVLGYGIRPARMARSALALPVLTTLALVPGIGIGALGAITLALGAVGLIGTTATLLLSVPAVALLVTDRQLPRDLAALCRRAGNAARRWPSLMIALAVTLCLMVLASAAPPAEVDEVEYHWPAAVSWAAHGTLNDSPYRHVDGFPFMEVVYTAAATVHSATGAHLLHLLCLFMLAAAAGGIARTLRVADSVPIVAAVLALPVAASQSYLAYNDVGAAAFSLLAVGLLLVDVSSRQHLAAAIIALAVAISIKPTAAFTAVVLGLLLALWPPLFESRRPALKAVLGRWMILVGTTAAVLGAWTLRRYLVTGGALDAVLSASPSSDVLSRSADLTDKLLIPIMPFGLGVMGTLQPWGGRIGFVLAAFLPVAIFIALRTKGRTLRVFALLAIPAYVHWIALAYAGPPRTRFQIVAWCLLIVAVWSVIQIKAHYRLCIWAWITAVVLGFIDNAFEMVRAISLIGGPVEGSLCAVNLLAIAICVIVGGSLLRSAHFQS